MKKKIKNPNPFSFHLNDTVTKYGKNNSVLNWSLERDVGLDPDNRIYHNKTILGLLGISTSLFQTM